ncbi:MAG: NAD kinase [Bacteroidetes bacterium]|nr:NAD kinase [Bacteroidota bacterium]
MTNIAIFGKVLADDTVVYLQSLVDRLEKESCRMVVFQSFYQIIRDRIRFKQEPITFTRQEEIRDKIKFLLSIGGDGTLLDTATLVGNSGIPILGINTGKLGFLSAISKEEILPSIDDILSGHYTLDQRTLLRLVEPANLFTPHNYALNELTIYKKAPRSMLTISAYINDEFLNSYWADGLIISTPTGSTAYSLSCTGPILTPQSANFVITPIASHNLTVRPLVIPDDAIIRIHVEGRDPHYYITLDSRIQSLDKPVEIIIQKEDFKINLLQMEQKGFLKTIREKLKWGLDIRN